MASSSFAACASASSRAFCDAINFFSSSLCLAASSVRRTSACATSRSFVAICAPRSLFWSLSAFTCFSTVARRCALASTSFSKTFRASLTTSSSASLSLRRVLVSSTVEVKDSFSTRRESRSALRSWYALRCACTRVFAADTLACESRTIPSIDPVKSYALLLCRSVLRPISSVPASSIASCRARPSVNCESCACSLDAALAMRPGDGVAAPDPGEPPDEPPPGLPPLCPGLEVPRNAVTAGFLTASPPGLGTDGLAAGGTTSTTAAWAFALPLPPAILGYDLCRTLTTPFWRSPAAVLAFGLRGVQMHRHAGVEIGAFC